MYSSTVDFAEVLQHFKNGCITIHNTCGIFCLAHQSMHHWAEVCMAVKGQHFENLL
jgi:hypothetical protein